MSDMASTEQLVEHLDYVSVKDARTFLCFSLLQMRLYKDFDPRILKIATASWHLCQQKNIRLFESSWINKVHPARSESCSTVLSLRWVAENSERLQRKGLSAMLLDSLLDLQRAEIEEVVRLLKQICHSGIGLFLIDDALNLIDIGSMGDVISSDNYLDIWVASFASASHTVVVNEETRDASNYMRSSERDYESGARLWVKRVRIPVWIEQQPDGDFRIVR